MNSALDLTTYISNEFHTLPGSVTFEHIFAYSLSYITGGYSAFEYQSLIKPFCKEAEHLAGKCKSAKNVRLGLLTDKSIYFRLKLFAIRRAAESSSLTRLCYETKVSKSDAMYASRVLRQNPPFQKRLAKLYWDVTKEHNFINEAELDSNFRKVYDQVIKYVKAITWRKLRFIAKSSNLELEDIHSELLLKVVQSYYQIVPTTKSFQHIVNYMCRAVHNHAMNFISSNTSLKRGRLVNVGQDQFNNDVFSLTVTSENQLNVTSVEGESIGYDQLAGHSPMTRFELEFSVSQLLSKYKLRSRKYRLLLLLMGTIDQEFTQWLRARKLLRASEQNDDLQALKPDEYRRLVIKFLRVDTGKAEVFLLNVGKQLGYRINEEHYGLRKAA